MKNKYLFDTDKENVCVMFSGGFDSTLLLIKALEMKNANLIREVYVTYIDCDRIACNEKQKEAVNSIMSHLKETISDFKVNNVQIDLSNVRCVWRIQMAQTMMFLPICLLGIPDNTEIWFGMLDHTTLTNTCSTSVAEEAMNNVVGEIQKHFSALKNITIKCPIMDYGDCIESRKAFVVRHLLEYYKIFELCFSCEDQYPHEHDCACIKHRELLTALMGVYEFDYYTLTKKNSYIPGAVSNECLLRMEHIVEYMRFHFPGYLSFIQDLANKISRSIPENTSSPKIPSLGEALVEKLDINNSSTEE